jgi:hypothetical protein
MTTVNQTCLNVSCSHTKMEYKPEGHNKTYAWLVVILCPICITPKFICKGGCRIRDGRKNHFYRNMKRVLSNRPIELLYTENSPRIESMQVTADKFQKTFVQGNILEAASLLVSQAAFQSPNLFTAKLPPPNIMLFLYLGKLVISSGLLEQYNLAKVVSILYPYAGGRLVPGAMYHFRIPFFFPQCIQF